MIEGYWLLEIIEAYYIEVLLLSISEKKDLKSLQKYLTRVIFILLRKLSYLKASQANADADE